jgi:hypothetical protein
MGTRFVIFAMERSASGHLCDQLRAQPDIWCHNEVFHPGKVLSTKRNFVDFTKSILRYLGAGTEVVPLENRAVRGPADIASWFSSPETVRAFLSDHGLMHWTYENDTSFEPLS